MDRRAMCMHTKVSWRPPVLARRATFAPSPKLAARSDLRVRLHNKALSSSCPASRRLWLVREDPLGAYTSPQRLAEATCGARWCGWTKTMPLLPLSAPSRNARLHQPLTRNNMLETVY